MKFYHRIIGDPPKRGFGKAIGSAGFPNGAAWADNNNAVRLPATVPIKTTDKESNGLIKTHESYEYQTLLYGQVALILSAQGMSVVNDVYSRPHGYTHIVAPEYGMAGRIATDCFEPCQLLCYDKFLSLKNFWDIPENADSYPATDWQLPALSDCTFSWDKTLLGDLLPTLIARYWKAATIRAFDNRRELHPVEVCLDDEGHYQTLINHAKAFFVTIIIPYLPRSVLNILSMSAAVPKRSIQLFQPTAMVFLYPEKDIAPNEQFFDLRTGRYTPLDASEMAFARSLPDGAVPPMLADAFKCFQMKTDCPDPTHCTFMADYDVAYAIDRVQHDRLDPFTTPQELLKLWRDLTTTLTTRHGINRELCHAMLEPVVQRILRNLISTEKIVPMDENMLSFLFQEALLASHDNLWNHITQLICRHQDARLRPFFLGTLPIKALPENEAKLAHITERILCECFVETLPESDDLEVLTKPGFIEICKRYPDFSKALTNYIQRALDRHPESMIYLLPLSGKFLPGSEMLKHSIRLMIKQYVSIPPDDTICNNIKIEYIKYPNEENRKLLAEYIALYFGEHLNNLSEFSRVIKLIGADMTGSLCAILEDAGNRPDQFLTIQQIHLLLVVSSNKADKELIKQKLLDYLQIVLNRSIEMGSDCFDWLRQVDSQGNLLSKDLRLRIMFSYVSRFMYVQNIPLHDHVFEALIQIIKDIGSSFALYEKDMLKAYDRLMDLGLPQIKQLMKHVSNVSEYPYVRSIYLKMMQEWLICNWQEQQNYWILVDELYNFLPKGSIKVNEVLDDPLTLQQAQQTLYAALQSITTIADFETELCEQSKRKPDSFYSLWKTALSEAFKNKYPTLLARDCQSLDDVQRLENFKHSLIEKVQAEETIFDYCAISLLDAMDLCLKMPLLEKDKIVFEAKKIISPLVECSKEPTCHQPLSLMSRYFFKNDMLQNYSYQAKVAVGLICSYWEGLEIAADAVLKLIGKWDKKIAQNPYSPQGLHNLQAVAMLFNELENYDHELPKALTKHLLSDPYFMGYTRSVRADKKSLEQYFPWCSVKKPTFIKTPHTAQMIWLTGDI